MRVELLCSLFLMAAACLSAQPAAEIRVVIQGDDMAAAHSINSATIRAYKDGILRTTNLIVPGAWLLEAVQLLEQNPGLDVGVHLTLTSEWQLVKWRPLTAGRSFTDANGYFLPMVYPSPNFPPQSSLKEAAPDIQEVERELRAQIELAKRLVPRVSYMSAHMGLAGPFPEWQKLLEKLAAEYRLPLAGSGAQWLNAGWARTDNGALRAEKLAKVLDAIGPGTWFMIEHAGEDTPEMRAMGHKGYEDVAHDRAAVTEAWTSPRVKEVIQRRGIRLSGWPEVLKTAR